MTGKEFSEIRKRLKISQKEMQKWTGYKYRTIQDWEAMEEVPAWAEIIIKYVDEKLNNKGSEESIERLNNQIDDLIDDKIKLKKEIYLLQEKLDRYEGNQKSQTA